MLPLTSMGIIMTVRRKVWAAVNNLSIISSPSIDQKYGVKIYLGRHRVLTYVGRLISGHVMLYMPMQWACRSTQNTTIGNLVFKKKNGFRRKKNGHLLVVIFLPFQVQIPHFLGLTRLNKKVSSVALANEESLPQLTMMAGGT